MIEIIDDYLSTVYFGYIEEVCTSSYFEWFTTDNITDDQNPKLSYLGFSHPILINGEFPNSNFSNSLCGFLYDTLSLVKKKNVIRSRFDMTVYNPNKLMHNPHVDLEDPYIPNITTILYITDNVDSDTIIFDKKITSKEDKKNVDISNLKILKQIQPKKNRMVIFDGSYLHTGHSPIYENKRILINSNFV